MQLRNSNLARLLFYDISLAHTNINIGGNAGNGNGDNGNDNDKQSERTNDSAIVAEQRNRWHRDISLMTIATTARAARTRSSWRTWHTLQLHQDHTASHVHGHAYAHGDVSLSRSKL